VTATTNPSSRSTATRSTTRCSRAISSLRKGRIHGADSKRKGKFEVVDGGRIFLDEIGDISPRMQAAMLRVLQDGELIRVGGNTPVKVDVRIIAATNRNLEEEVRKGASARICSSG